MKNRWKFKAAVVTPSRGPSIGYHAIDFTRPKKKNHHAVRPDGRPRTNGRVLLREEIAARAVLLPHNAGPSSMFTKAAIAKAFENGRADRDRRLAMARGGFREPPSADLATQAIVGDVMPDAS